MAELEAETVDNAAHQVDLPEGAVAEANLPRALKALEEEERAPPLSVVAHLVVVHPEAGSNPAAVVVLLEVLAEVPLVVEEEVL